MSALMSEMYELCKQHGIESVSVENDICRDAVIISLKKGEKICSISISAMMIYINHKPIDFKRMMETRICDVLKSEFA